MANNNCFLSSYVPKYKYLTNMKYLIAFIAILSLNVVAFAKDRCVTPSYNYTTPRCYVPAYRPNCNYGSYQTYRPSYSYGYNYGSYQTYRPAYVYTPSYSYGYSYDRTAQRLGAIGSILNAFRPSQTYYAPQTRYIEREVVVNRYDDGYEEGYNDARNGRNYSPDSRNSEYRRGYARGFDKGDR